MDHLYRDIIEQAPFAFVCHQTVRDDSGTIVDFIVTDVNAAYETFTHKSKSETIGKKISRLLSKEAADAYDWLGFFADVITRESTEEISVFVPNLNHLINIKACAAEEGNLLVYFTVRESDSNLSQMKTAQFSEVIASSPTGMMLTDSNGMLLELNTHAGALLGINTKTFGELSLNGFIGAEAQEAAAEFFGALRQNGSANASFLLHEDAEHIERKQIELYATKVDDNLFLYHVNELRAKPEYGASEGYGADTFTDLFIATIDPEYRYLYFNAAFTKAMSENCSNNTVHGGSFSDAISDPILKTELLKDVEKALQGTAHTTYHRAPWSPSMLCEYCFHPVFADSGQTIGANFYIKALGTYDFDAKNEPSTINQDAESIQSFFLDMKKGAAVFSVEGNGDRASDYILRNFNTLGKQNLTAKYAKLLGKRLDELLPDMDESTILSALKSVWQNNRSAYLPPSVYHTDNQSFLFETNLFRVNTGDIILMFQNLEEKSSIDNRNNEDRFEMIASNVTEVIWLVDTQMNLTYLSPSVERLFGIKPESLLGHSLLEHMSEEAFLQIKLELVKSFTRPYSPLAGNDTFSHECEIKNGKGYPVNAEFSARLLRDGNHTVIGVIGTTRELSEIKRLARALRRSEETMRLLLNSTAESIFGVDEYRCITFMNSMCLKMLGFTEQDDLVGKNVYDNIRLYRANGTPYEIDNYPINRVFRGEYIHLEKDICVFGDRGFIPVEYYAYPQYTDDKVTGAVITFFDISERRKQEEDIKYLNFHDTSTNLYNRNYMDRSLNMLDQSYNLPLSYLMADINGLKNINDEYGFAQGDKHIRDTAKILSSCVRGDDILARIGGDEFAVLMTRTDNLTANELMEKIHRNIEEHNAAAEDVMQQITLSMGLSTKNFMFESLQTIIKEAENHMQQRKLLEDKSQKSTILTSMKTTLFERSQETELHAERLVLLSHAMAKKLHLTQTQCNELELLAMLHDIGKISIDDNIINKPGKLTDEEWDAIKKHPEAGYRIAMATPELQPIANYILRHHERWDGKGYPGGLSGNEIPLLSRIISVVDAYDAMTQDRVYRKALPIDTAIEEIMRNAGTQFDPEIARLFVQVAKEVEG